ncbi:MAG: DNA-processing protein DprA [Candidatus Levyibacteriota bacterium]
MPIDPHALAWAELAARMLPQRAVVELLRSFGGPEAVLSASRAQLSRIVAPAIVDRVLAPAPGADLESVARWLEDPAHSLIAWDDPDYPRALLEVGDAPPVLFHVGRRDLLNAPAMAIVGSRNATPQGIATAREFAAALCTAGLTIVSGLAEGIDAAAHAGALERTGQRTSQHTGERDAARAGAPVSGSTIAVVGTGPDRVYPAKNRALAAQIAARGALLSEYFPGTPARKENFPRRNRLISGLARGVLVVEATLSSGSLITARLAGEQGREVFAIPGSIHSPFARGCHKLIREGAKLVETAQDVLVELGWSQVPAAGSAAAARGGPGPGAGGSAGRSEGGGEAGVPPLLAAMGYDPVAVDELVARSGLAASEVGAQLVQLQLEERVDAMPGGLWQRRR